MSQHWSLQTAKLTKCNPGQPLLQLPGHSGGSRGRGDGRNRTSSSWNSPSIATPHSRSRRNCATPAWMEMCGARQARDQEEVRPRGNG